MDSPLSSVPIGSRRRLAATLALFAVLFAAVGGVAVAGPSAVAAPVFSVLASVVSFAVSALLALLAWGVRRSVTIDLGEQQLDRAIEQTVAAAGPAATCGCGHEHDPGEMHVRAAPPRAAEQCAHDGAGASCAHDCATCVLSRRPSSGATLP